MESSGYQEPRPKLHTTSTAPPRDPSRSSGLMTATACGLTLHNYPRHTTHSSRTNPTCRHIQAFPSATWHSTSRPHQVPGMARKTDGKLALNRHPQATSCKEPMGMSWSPNSGPSDPLQPAPTWLCSTAPRNFFTATTSRQPPPLPHNGPTTPGKPGKTHGPNGSRNTPSTANPHQDHQPQTESSRPRNASKQTYRPHSKSSLTPIGAAGTEITTWRPLTRLASRPDSTSSKPMLRNSKSKTPNSSTGSRRRPLPMQPPTPNSPQLPNRSAPTRLSSRCSTKVSMSATTSCDGKCPRALATSRPFCRKKHRKE